MKPVLCVRNDREDTLGISHAALAAESVAVLRRDGFAGGTALPEIEEISGLIVFGGEMNVDEIERYPYLLAQRQLMRRAIDSGMPVLGICLGAQMMARALDAPVYRAPVRELGFYPVTLTGAGQGDTLLGHFQSGDRVFEWHEDTFDLPQGATLLAAGAEVPVQAFRFGPNAWGVQFHFEVDRAGVEAWLAVAQPGLRRVWNRDATEVRAELDRYLEAQQQRGRRLFASFARCVLAANP
ncbi:MAG TPA: gamma-glutamyl-gamma-aminobutyrate hydrolase family protein [Candidatus Dormibacteraeota bacterium]